MERELKLLHRRNLDGYHGYTLASESIQNGNFKNFLKTYARQRKKYADEIEAELVKRGIKASDNTTILGDLHEVFSKLRNTVLSINDKEILNECARGENQSVSDYDKVLKSNQLPPDLQKMAMRHYDKIRAAEQTLRKLASVI